MTVHRPQALAEFRSHGRNGTDCRSVATETYTSNGTLHTEVLKSLDSGSGGWGFGSQVGLQHRPSAIVLKLQHGQVVKALDANWEGFVFGPRLDCSILPECLGFGGEVSVWSFGREEDRGFVCGRPVQVKDPAARSVLVDWPAWGARWGK